MSGQVKIIDIGGSPTVCDLTDFEVTYNSLTCITRANDNIAPSSTNIEVIVIRNAKMPMNHMI
jgi:hypothetical protein